MPDTQISEETLDIAARAVYAVSVQAIEPALGIPMCKFEELPERDLNLHRDYARAAITAALSGHVVGWRTMDSAPKDGTEIMVAGGKFYSTADDWKTEYEHTDWNLASWRDGGWQGERDEQYDTFYYYKPTHWMPKVPLPAPPVPEMEG